MIECFNLLIKNWPQAVFLISEGGEIIAANISCEKTLGLSAREFKGKGINDLVCDSREKVSRYLRNCLRSSEPVPGSLSLRRSDGQIIKPRCSGFLIQRRTIDSDALLFLVLEPERLPSDKFITLNNALENLRSSYHKLYAQTELLKGEIDERKKAVAALEISNQRFNTVLDSQDVLVYVIDMNTYEILYINQYTRNLFGDVTGKTCWQTLQANQTGPCKFCTNKYLLDEKGNPTGVHTWEMKNTVNGRWYELRDRAIQWIDGRVVRFEVGADVTARKEDEEELRKYREHLEGIVKERTADLEEKTHQLQENERALLNVVEDLRGVTDELKQANEKLKELDRMKSVFIASMSHELRTPLNSIIGFSSIVMEEWFGPLNEEQKKNLSTVLRSARHLLALINDVIDVSKIEAGKLETVCEDFDAHDVLSEAVELFRKEISEKGLELQSELIHHDMHTDRRRLFQCLTNLISNALKFTESGKIKIVARLIRDSLEVSVADTGVGIKEEDMPKLFSPFVRIPSPLSSKVKGTGLGLYLTKKIATDLLTGEIRAESRYGEGSCFILRIPARLSAEASR